MKYAECNARQKKAYRNIYHACNWLLGGLENTMLDNPEGSEEVTGYAYEPWHIRYVEEKAAREITEQEITLEEYLDLDDL